MFIVEWFYDVLSYLGFYNKDARILFLGLDNAGKTTLLHMLKDDKVVVHAPTGHPQYEELVIGKVKFKTHDLGGHQTARRLWRDYFAKIDGIVYMVDSADPNRFSESKEELNGLLTCEDLAAVPFLVLGNKIDLPGAVREEDLRYALGLHMLTTGKTNYSVEQGIRPLELFMSSVVKKAGYAEGFQWLSKFLE
eukprot:120275_1